MARDVAKAREQQAGADEQHERRGHLQTHEPATDEPHMPSPGRAPSLLAQHCGRVDASQAEHRDQPEDRADEERCTEGDDEHRAVDPDLAPPRQPIDSEREESSDPSPAEDDAHHGTDDRQQHALGDELPCEADAISAEGHPHREVSAAPGGPHERQVGHVDAPDEQHEQHARPQQRERAPYVSHEVVLQGHHLGVIADV